MVLPQFEYLAPQSIDEACMMLSQYKETAKIMSGATDLIPSMKHKNIIPQYVIDIKNISELHQIKCDEEGLTIGALTTLYEIENSKTIQTYNPSIAYSAKVIGSKQVRTKATMVGNICHASPACDCGPILLVQDAKIWVQSLRGQRMIHMKDFFKGPHQTALENDEIVTKIVVPPLYDDECSLYMRHAIRKAMDIPIVSVAVKLKIKNGICRNIHIALGAVDVKPIRLFHLETLLLGQRVDNIFIEKASIEAMNACHPITDVRAHEDYRKDMVRVFVKRALLKAIADFQEE